MTPYAVLLVRPGDTDETISARFRELSRGEHPDSRADGRPGPRWYAITTAYGAVRTGPDREALGRAARLDARRCARCAGSGVLGSRAAGGKIRVCVVCLGEGRWK
jgi:curved DNA-binding protein CbpA